MLASPSRGPRSTERRARQCAQRCVSRHIGFISGERSILDAVKKGLELPADALVASREVLSCFGNMSSAKVMFVLQRMMQQARPGQHGCAMAFGPD